MENQSLVRTAKTVDEAIELAMLELAAGRDEVEVDVISRGRSGILGIGSEPAKVRVSLITGDRTTASAGLGLVERLLDGMAVDATAAIRASGSGPDDPAIIDIQGEDAGLIIGRRGETLRSLQFLVNVMLSKQEGEHIPVQVDVEQYRERRQRQLTTLAERSAERVIESGRSVTLEPMSPADRRIIHIALAGERAVMTESTGEGPGRRVTIAPTGEPSSRIGGARRSPRRRRGRDD